MRKLGLLAGLLVVAMLAIGCGGSKQVVPTDYVIINAPAGHSVERDGDTYTIRPIETDEESYEDDSGENEEEHTTPKANALRFLKNRKDRAEQEPEGDEE